MKRRGHAVQYLPCDNSAMAQFYNHLLVDGHVDSKLLGKVFDSCPTLFDKVNFLSAIMMQPPTEQLREWTEAFGLAWMWVDILQNGEFEIEVNRLGFGEPSPNCDERIIN